MVVADPSLAFTSLAAADTFSCGVLANATAVCWGGYTDASQSELLPAGLRELKPKQPQLFAALAARGSTVCGLTLQHSILCSGGPAAAGACCVGRRRWPGTSAVLLLHCRWLRAGSTGP